MNGEGDGILVNAICPGWVETDMAKDSIQRMAEAQGISYAESHAQQCAVLPTGKMSSPEEMAEAVAWLMSPGQTGMTGQGVDVNNELDVMKNGKQILGHHRRALFGNVCRAGREISRWSAEDAMVARIRQAMCWERVNVWRICGSCARTSVPD